MSRRAGLSPGETVKYTGGMSIIMIDGDIGYGATLTVTGGMNDVTITGQIDECAIVKVTGGMNTLRYNGKHPLAQVILNGGMNDEYDTSVGKKSKNKLTLTRPEKPKGEFTVQKSHRPKEQWGK